MKKINKKRITLGIMAIAAVAAPIATVVSCGNSTKVIPQTTDSESTRFAELSRELANLESQKQKMELTAKNNEIEKKKFDQVKKELDDKRKEFVSMQSKSDEISLKLIKVNKTISSLAKKDKVEEGISKSLNAKKNLEKEQAKRQESISLTESKTKKMNSDIKNLDKEIDDLNSDLALAIQKMESKKLEKEDEIAVGKNKPASPVAKSITKEEELNQLKADIENIKLKIKDLEDQKSALNQEITLQKDKISKIRTELNKKNIELQNLEKDIKKLEDEKLKINELYDRKRKLSIAFEGTQTNIRNFKRDNDDYITKLEEKYNAMKFEYIINKMNIDSNSKKISHLYEIIKTLTKENKAKKDKNEIERAQLEKDIEKSFIAIDEQRKSIHNMVFGSVDVNGNKVISIKELQIKIFELERFLKKNENNPTTKISQKDISDLRERLKAIKATYDSNVDKVIDLLQSVGAQEKTIEKLTEDQLKRSITIESLRKQIKAGEDQLGKRIASKILELKKGWRDYKELSKLQEGYKKMIKKQEKEMSNISVSLAKQWTDLQSLIASHGSITKNKNKLGIEIDEVEKLRKEIEKYKKQIKIKWWH